ncbi:MAG: type transport system permease protein [Solirubrobacteraceae bacterium]|nr:type transport system permease protein [Solirubrobacteraceae bacterium]
MTRTVWALARRALRNLLRRPQFIAPLVVFPTLMLAVNVGGLSRTTTLPGFTPGVHGFLDFQLAAAITQSLLLGGVSAGIAVALEIEGGFFDRLVAAPIPRLAIVLGRLVATTVIAVAQVAYFLALGLILGAHIRSGVPGALLVAGIGALAGTGFGALGVMIALRARSASTVQGIFPLVFVVLFVSTAFFPRNLLESPAREIARFNPLSYLADGMREPIIHPLQLAAVLDGFAAAAGIAVVAGALSVLALRGRLRDA